MFNDIKAFILSIWDKLHSKNFIKRFSWLIVTSVLTLLIPLSIAICYMQIVEKEKNIESPTITVSIFEPNGDILYSDETTEQFLKDSYLSHLLYDLSSSKEKATKPIGFAKEQTMGFSVKYGDELFKYSCYFEEDVGESYMEDQNGEFYAPDATAYLSFLNSSYAEMIYKEASPPSLYTALEESVTPLSSEWNYLLENKKEVSAKKTETTDEILSYRITGAIDFKFSRKPDSCQIEIKKLDGTLVFSGKTDELSKITADEGDELLIKMNAEWKSNEEFSSHGHQEYEFKIICSEPATFALSSMAAYGGQVIVISAYNITATDTVAYSIVSDDPLSTYSGFISSLSKEDKALYELYSYQPIFTKGGSNAYALLPIPANVPQTTLKFSLSCGISKAEFSIDIKEAIQTDITVDAKDQNKKISISSAESAEFMRTILSLKHSDSDMLLTYEKFLSPESYGFTSNYSYNTKVNDSFCFLANSYTAPSAFEGSVKSIGIGRVYLSGSSDILGNYVIVDHGMGLLSWYCGLSTVNVEAGDIVTSKDSLGLVGSSSLLCENGVNVMCSVGGILVNPNEILGRALITQ